MAWSDEAREAAAAARAKGGATAVAAQHGISTEHLAGAAPWLQTTGAPGRSGQVASWVIRNKTTGEPQMETYNPALSSHLNTDKYDMVPVHQHLAEVNDPNSPAGKWARR